jgi:integrase
VRGQQNFERYVRDKWFPNHRLELRSREGYSYYLEKRIIPWFRHMRLIEIMPYDIREFITDMERQGVKASSIGYCVTILSAVFTTALNDQAVFFHPCRGVRVPVVAKKVRRIVTPEQYDLLHQALAEEKWQLLVETDIETGLRWGELAELRPKDFCFQTRRITVTRVIVELTPKFHPTGGRFLVKEYPKDDEHRMVSISAELTAKIRAYITEHGIGADDLIFTKPPQEEKQPRLRVVQDPGMLLPIMSGGVATKYKHGTISGYSGAMKCRCEQCTGAYADYRYRRRRGDRDRPVRPRAAPDTEGHIPRRWFSENVWQPARAAAGLGDGVTMHSLRHAHASWLQVSGVASGASFGGLREHRGPGVQGQRVAGGEGVVAGRHAA